MHPDYECSGSSSCSVSCASIYSYVDGFMDVSPSSKINLSHELEGFARVSVELPAHTGNSYPESLQHEHEPKHEQCKCTLRQINIHKYFPR
jgi:hypothetical protein